jgi:outer membrane protein, adhesin transport system
MASKQVIRVQMRTLRSAMMLAGCCHLMSACMGAGLPGVSEIGFGGGGAPADVAVPALSGKGEVRSVLIDELKARQTILPSEGSFAEIADAVTEAGTGLAAAELRVAELRAQAQARNWLPRIGPNANLTSLGSIAASILVEQSLFDAGRRKAERAFAAADVELAAIALATERNKRVYEGLKHYLAAERAREQAAVSERALSRLVEFERVMALRVEGGLSDRSELRLLSQKLSEIKATLAADRQLEAAAMAELAAMTTRDMTFLRGIQTLPPDLPNPEPLSVVRARGESARTKAEVQMAAANMLPGLTARAEIGKGGVNSGIGFGGGDFGFGSGATRQKLEATGDLIERRTAQASEDANRRLVALDREMRMIQMRETEGADVLHKTIRNLDLFTEQQKVGRRSMLELVQQYESFARAERDQVALKYLAADLRLQIARERGVLVDGASM